VRYRVAESQIRRCRQCSQMWLFPRPSLDDLKNVYDISYFQNERFFVDGSTSLYGYYDYLAERFVRQSSYVDMVRKIRELIAAGQKRPIPYVDIGCGMGYLMDVAHDEGFAVSGVEFNASAAARLREKYVFPVHVGDVLEFQAGPFMAVTMMDVVEHLLDPFKTLAHVGELMLPGGVLALSTMDCDSIPSKLLGTRVEDLRRTREHLFFFTRRSIAALLDQSGFDVLSIHSYGHSFRLAFLADRLKLVSQPLGRLVSRAVRGLGLQNMRVYINPHTKMLVYARKR
jgi:SAM-dependent methyltransferase